MSRPAQLEKQIERMKEIQTAIAEGKDPNAPVEPVEETPTEPAVTEPVVTPTADESPVTVSKEEFDKLEQRYRTLQGMHAADGQRFRNETAALQSALQDLEDRLVAAENTNRTTTPPKRYVTDEDVAEYGDTLEMVRRAAREEAETIAQERDKANLERIANLERLVGHVQNTVVPAVENMSRAQVEQVKAEFWGNLKAQVPDWEPINEDPKFKAWLTTEDPLTGATRQQFLRQAQYNYDYPRAIAFFKEWKRLSAGGQTPAPNTAQTDLERLVAPGASKGGTVPTTPEKKIWSRADIATFFKDVQTGKYLNKLDERKKIEADIFAAQAEGRISS